MSLLKALYCGNIPAFSEINLWNEEYAKLVDEIVQVEAELSQISPEASKLLSRYQDLQSAINTIIHYHEFRTGFQVGAQLMQEMMKDLRDNRR